jgi:hypothetical protein
MTEERKPNGEVADSNTAHVDFESSAITSEVIPGDTKGR